MPAWDMDMDMDMVDIDMHMGHGLGHGHGTWTWTWTWAWAWYMVQGAENGRLWRRLARAPGAVREHRASQPELPGAGADLGLTSG
jgi:hypothetical protein